MKKLIKGLLGINCRYNFKVMGDGKCRSKECMLNQDKELSLDIAEKGCEIYKRLKNENNKTPLQEKANG